MILSFKYRLLPTRAQHFTLARILEEQRQLYNARRPRITGTEAMNVSEADVEKAARAMEPRAFAVYDSGYTACNWIEERAFLNAEKVVKRARKKARLALEAVLSSQPEGYVLVPKEPTEEMVVQGMLAALTAAEPYRNKLRASDTNGWAAVEVALGCGKYFTEAYRAMLAALPEERP